MISAQMRVKKLPPCILWVRQTLCWPKSKKIVVAGYITGNSSISRAEGMITWCTSVKRDNPCSLPPEGHLLVWVTEGCFLCYVFSVFCWASWTTSLWNQALAEFLRASPGEKAGNTTAPIWISPQVLHISNLKLPETKSHGCEPYQSKANLTILCDRL